VLLDLGQLLGVVYSPAAGGNATATLATPVQPHLAGLVVHFQSPALDPTAPQGLRPSNAARAEFCP
jgi:hypothetical protein